jgi:hypothetical protein
MTLQEALATLEQTLSYKGQYYGDTFDLVPRILRILYESRRNEQGQYLLDDRDWDNMIALTRVLDKICRIVAGDRGEESAWKDIAGYAILRLQRTRAADSGQS